MPYLHSALLSGGWLDDFIDLLGLEYRSLNRLLPNFLFRIDEYVHQLFVLMLAN